MKKSNKEITEIAIKTAIKSPCNYFVSAVALDKHGKFICSAYNNHRINKKGGGFHAELQVIRKSKKVKYIILARTNKNGKLLPIDSCESCQKVCDKLGIKVISLYNLED